MTWGEDMGNTGSEADRLLIEEIKFGNEERSRRLIEDGADPNSTDEEGLSALHWAVLLRRTATTGLLIKSGANVNADNGRGDTTIHMAAAAGNIGLMKKLMKAGADLYATDNSGADPLYVLKIFKYGKYIKYSKELAELDMKIKNDTLKHEDSRRKTSTGYEFDI